MSINSHTNTNSPVLLSLRIKQIEHSRIVQHIIRIRYVHNSLTDCSQGLALLTRELLEAAECSGERQADVELALPASYLLDPACKP